MAYYPCESKHKKYKLRIDWDGITWRGHDWEHIRTYTVYIIDTSTNTITFSEGSHKTEFWYASNNACRNLAEIMSISLTEIK